MNNSLFSLLLIVLTVSLYKIYETLSNTVHGITIMQVVIVLTNLTAIAFANLVTVVLRILSPVVGQFFEDS